ncbi:MAG TPA: hypothetical protein VKN99_10525, partial [Polyangia bacterium]|nr:hypothetical protein [Polyangia bacterium]
AHSPAVLVPPAQPAPPGPVEWMQVAAPQRRDGELEPIVVVARGKERLRAGGPAGWHAGAWQHPGLQVPQPAQPAVEGGPETSWVRWPGSSNAGRPGGR